MFRGKRIEKKIDELTALIKKGFLITMSQLEDVVSAINTATNAIADGLTAEGSAILTVASEVSSLRSQLTAAPTVTQATLDALAAIQSKLASSATTIQSQSTQLQAIAADPANPVPTPAPATPPAPAA
jgi:uncharacterized phage infection (PIP) family protein YhgE